MKLDDLIAADTVNAVLDPDLKRALALFGFVKSVYSLFSHPTKGYVATIEGERADGTKHTWTGVGKTADLAHDNLLDAIAKWVLQQPHQYFTP